MNYTKGGLAGTMMQRTGGTGFFEAVLCMFATIFFIVLTVYVVLLIIDLIKRWKVTGTAKIQNSAQNFNITPALAILNERLARGEITPEDYQRLKAEISK